MLFVCSFSSRPRAPIRKFFRVQQGLGSTANPCRQTKRPSPSFYRIDPQLSLLRNPVRARPLLSKRTDTLHTALTGADLNGLNYRGASEGLQASVISMRVLPSSLLTPPLRSERCLSRRCHRNLLVALADGDRLRV